MRPGLLTPDGEITPDLLIGILDLIGEIACTEDVTRWSPLERAVVCDWAAREHLAASDSPVRRRPRPWLLGPQP